jgi:hypothetical protein
VNEGESEFLKLGYEEEITQAKNIMLMISNNPKAFCALFTFQKNLPSLLYPHIINAGAF